MSTLRQVTYIFQYDERSLPASMSLNGLLAVTVECALNFVALNISKFGLEASIYELEADHLKANKV